MTYIKQLAQQIIKDRVVIDNKGDETLYSEIVKEFCKRGFKNEQEFIEQLFRYTGFDTNFIINSYKFNDKFTTLTLPEFIARYPLDPRGIIGWKSKEEFRNHLIKLFGSILVYNESESPSIDLKSDSPFIELMRNLGCLELWFNPVYKEVEIPPKGTPVLDEWKNIWISKGEIKNMKLKVCRCLSSMHIDHLGDELSTWTVYK